LAYSFRRTGALWFALGCHGAWDFAETYLYGVPDSGMTAPGALSHAVLHGPAWLTGGVTGPEASWLVFPVLAGIAAVVHFGLRRAPDPSM
jgi:membrane protease YdiL (CAAX protease family)